VTVVGRRGMRDSCVVVLLEVVDCTWKRQKSYRAISSHGGVGSISSARVGATAAQCCDVVDRTGALQVIGDAWLHEVTVWRDEERRIIEWWQKLRKGSMEHWYGTALSHSMEHRNGAALHLSRHRTLERHIVKSRRQDTASQVGMMA
jgi:hypothetical protein